VYVIHKFQPDFVLGLPRRPAYFDVAGSNGATFLVCPRCGDALFAQAGFTLLVNVLRLVFALEKLLIANLAELRAYVFAMPKVGAIFVAIHAPLEVTDGFVRALLQGLPAGL
jgi:hypothetical protein